MRNVLRCMNVHPISSSAFTSLNGQVAVAFDKAVNNSRRNAAAEVRQKNPVPNPCIIPYSTCRVSVDGSWQRRGHAYVVSNIDPEKYECVGHVQKRLGTRLRNKVKEFKGTETPLCGRNKLTKRTMDYAKLVLYCNPAKFRRCLQNEKGYLSCSLTLYCI